jgi:hypothetical protein
VHFNTGPMAVSHYKTLRARDLEQAASKVMADEGVSPALLGQRLGDADPHGSPKRRTGRNKRKRTQDKFAALGLNYELGDQMINAGVLGICMIDAAEGDFVHQMYLCDRYKSRIKVDDADKPDELPEEARKRIYGDDA